MDKVHRVYDISKASKAEKREIKQALEAAMEEILTEACNMIERGEFHGCAYVHLEISAAQLQKYFPCEDCSTEVPPRREFQ